MSALPSAVGTAFGRVARVVSVLPKRAGVRRFSIFEKVIIANSVIILLDTAAGWWITQHNPETYHYLIDTLFIAMAGLLGLVVNFFLLRAAFAPLHSVLATIRAVEDGDLEARAEASESDPDAEALARGFNAMLDRLALARDQTAARVLRGQEDERRRIALELHDQTGQSLTALMLHTEAIAQRLGGESSAAAVQARAQAERLSALAQDTLAEVQALSRQLRPPMLDDLGLPAALRWLAEDAWQRLGVAVRARVRLDEAERLPEDVEIALYRIAQESLTNSVRHGQARHVRLALTQRAATVTLTIADDGRGFAYPREMSALRNARHTGGLGLQGMRERLHPLGGWLQVRSQPGRGCTVHATAPLPAGMVALRTAATSGEPGEERTSVSS